MHGHGMMNDDEGLIATEFATDWVANVTPSNFCPPYNTTPEVKEK